MEFDRETLERFGLDEGILSSALDLFDDSPKPKRPATSNMRFHDWESVIDYAAMDQVNQHVGHDPMMVIRLTSATKDFTTGEASFAFQIGDDIHMVNHSSITHRSRQDTYDMEIGVKLTYARLLEGLAKTLRRQAEGKMESNEHNAAKSAQSKADKKARDAAIAESRGNKAASELHTDASGHETWVEVEEEKTDDPEATEFPEDMNVTISAPRVPGRMSRIFGRG